MLPESTEKVTMCVMMEELQKCFTCIKFDHMAKLPTTEKLLVLKEHCVDYIRITYYKYMNTLSLNMLLLVVSYLKMVCGMFSVAYNETFIHT